MSLPIPKTDVGEIINKRLIESAGFQAQNAQAVLGLGPATWCRPVDITKSYSSEEGNSQVREAFSRKEQETWFDESTKNARDLGTRGDFIQIQLQGDLMACKERAYRARHASSLKTRIHPAARLQGSGHEYGVIKQGLLGHIVGIDIMNKGENV